MWKNKEASYSVKRGSLLQKSAQGFRTEITFSGLKTSVVYNMNNYSYS